MSSLPRRAVVVGAGPAGSLMSIHLARRGWQVQVIERRPDPRDPGRRREGRSINLGLSARGLEALRQVGLEAAVRPHLVPMRGRAIHRRGGALVLQPYGTGAHEQLYSVLRDDLNALLLEEAARSPEVTLEFEATVSQIDLAGSSLTYETGEGRHEVTADLVIGADGLNSVVRRALVESHPDAELSREDLPWGYKELTIPAGPDGRCRTELEALHVWPEEDALMVGHPNVDGSITCTLFLPYEGRDSFATLVDAESVNSYARRHLPDALDLMPDLAEEFMANPVGHLSTIRARPWQAEGRVVLIGDAAHAVYPFYGQGMNSALEDCTVLAGCLDEHLPLEDTFAEFERRRKPHLDVLADLSIANFDELRSHVASPIFLLRKKIDMALHRLAPELWRPLYTMVSHSTTPYADAVHRARVQDRVLDGALIASGSAVLLTLAGGLRTYLRGRTR